MPSTPRQTDREDSPSVTPQQNETHGWAHFRALLRDERCPVCDYDPSKDLAAIAAARLHAVFDDRELPNLEWGAPPSDATDAEIRIVELVRAREAPPLKQAPSPMSEEQRAEADAARRQDEYLKELVKLINPGLSAEREREVDQKVAEGRRLYRAARGRGRPHAAARQAANKDGTKKGRWGRSRLYELAARWKSEWESEQPK